MRAAAAKSGLRFYGIKEVEELFLPLIGFVKAGFPSPADNFLESDIDLVAFFGMNKPYMRIVRVEGDFLVDNHAPDGSLLIVDTLLKPITNDLVIVALNGDYLVRTIVKALNGWMLYSENTICNPTIIGEEDNFKVLGVVVQVILSTRHRARSKAGTISFEESIDLPTLLNMYKPSVYVVRTDGNSMEGEHLTDKSYLIVDRSLKPEPHDIAVAVLNGDFTVKKLIHSPKGWVLYAANNHYSPIPVKENDDFTVWGVVAHIVIDRKEMRKNCG
ncbi:LexA family protein [Chitinophaga niabensis]|uniref:Peptidase S24-like n=1 Tax=Chitinophaga niabensis TaxID=536979 RepID=A0A1N6KAY8_9BACT|nr:S24 family peptidase [Chitinophaga niabensis]SIO53701.1 Peptidase S24-like [Chitinophaga niabensis]